jgi:hypothetical protein
MAGGSGAAEAAARDDLTLPRHTIGESGRWADPIYTVHFSNCLNSFQTDLTWN